MSPNKIDNILSWANDLDQKTVDQATTTASMPFVNRPLALMPDAHLGMGSTVGSVVATSGAIMPSCVGVDIGCGMIAQRLAVTADELEPHLEQIHGAISANVPSGIPKGRNRGRGSHREPVSSAGLDALMATRPDAADQRKAWSQFGTLGSGNHFVEICGDADTGDAWIVLHSGSRNPGNTIARHHIEHAKGLMRDWFIDLPDPDLAYLVEGTEAFDHYISDMHWAQNYAFENRQAMLDAILNDVAAILADAGQDHAIEPADGSVAALLGEHSPINCHHNYTTQEHHHGKNMWITRKGAIQAREGTLGVIPGSMATGSFIVEGLGSRASYCSASHGAGRKMSRTQARKRLTADSLTDRMGDITWNRQSDALLDEHPEAYKDLGDVMKNQSDLVSIKHRLNTILNYKGT